MEDSKSRFSDRANDYKKYRPTYPLEVISFILQKFTIDKNWAVADIGSGTGISSKLLSWGLKCPIYAVEPNDNMRFAAECDEKENPFYQSVNGSAEATTLGNESVNLVCAFQSFHWFEKEKAKEEFRRILKKPKWLLLVWNDRVAYEDGFMKDYDNLLRELPEYRKSTHKSVSIDDIREFIGNSKIEQQRLVKTQDLNWEGLKGRFFSSSYTPKKDSMDYQNVIDKLRNLFDKYNIEGFTEFKYDTHLYLGQIK